MSAGTEVAGTAPRAFAEMEDRERFETEEMMNIDTLKSQWRQLKGEARVHWGKLTDDELDQVEGQFEKLVGLIQERYGYERGRAEQEVDAFLSAHPSRP